jgi:hypothetical protein
MFKKPLLLLATLIFLVFPKTSFAFKPETFVTIANPVRGNEGWTNPKQSALDLPVFQYQEATHSALPITWMLRLDAVIDATISSYFANLIEDDKTQSLGAFLEVTPNYAAQAGVDYPDGLSIFSANRVFLSGYSQKERTLLIDTFMDKFFTRFGFYPKSVAAWHIDSYSLQYLQSKYSVLTAMNCDDQYSMDHYRLWGGYIGSPYFPDKNNSLVPASSRENRINLAMVRWAQRDLYNFYGPHSSSLFSVQLNDYIALGKSTLYFDKLLELYSQKDFNEFTYINIGLENDYSLSLYRQEIKNQYKKIKEKQDKYNLHPLSLSDFGDWLKARYPESSPTYFYRTGDSTGVESGEVYWYQTPKYRIGLKAVDGQTKIIDFRVYNREIFEDYFATPNQDTSLYLEIPAIIDSIKYPGTELLIDVDFTKFETIYDKQWDLWQLSLGNNDQRITFYPDSISFTNIQAPDIDSKDIKVSQKDSITTWKTSPYMPLKDTHNYSWLLWTVVSLLVLAFLKKIKKKGLPKISGFLIVGFLSVLIISLTVFRNGLNFPFGLGFFGPNGHDAIFHLSLIEKFSQNPLDFSHPQFSGAKLTNYHFIFDYGAGLLSRIFRIPSPTLYFIILPLLIGLSLVFLLNKLMSLWHYTPAEKALSYILVFLSGSFGFIPKLLTSQDIFQGESAFWANQSASLFLNPPFALSLAFLILFLVNLPHKGKLKPIQFVRLALLGAVLAQTKVYAFILLVMALFLGGQLSLTIAVGTLGAIIGLPFSSFSGSPFSFDPLWFPRSLFASYDRFYWPRFVQAWQSYEASGNIIKLIIVNIFAFAVFLLGNLGLRVLGLGEICKKSSNILSKKIVSYLIILGLVLPLIITQKVNPWNTIQFMYYSLFFLSIFSAKVILNFVTTIKNIFIKSLVLIVILLIATATSIGTLKDYVGYFSPSRISYTEMRALDNLKGQPKGIVLSPLFKKAEWVAVPKPLYSYISTAYISAYSGQPEFMSDTINLDITNFDYKERSKKIQRFYNTSDKIWANSFLLENNIKYVYETPLQKIHLSPEDLSLEKIFDSGEINIYKLN